MNRVLFYTVAFSLAGLLNWKAVAQVPEMHLEKMRLPALEQKLEAIDTELAQLARLTLRNGVGSIGYRSKIRGSSTDKEWIRIDLDQEEVIDGIALSPMLFRDNQIGIQAEGFPRAFRILAGTGQHTNEVAVVSENETRLPRIAPLSFSFPPTKASWVMIETTQLSPRLAAKHYLLQLFEIMVFSGQENVAMNQSVTVPEGSPKQRFSMGRRFIVDGFTPYMMDAADGDQSKAPLLFIKDMDTPPRITLDLSTNRKINQINLHSANLSYSVPMGNFTTWGVPRHVRVTGANRPDFSDEILLCEYRQESIYDHGPIISRRFPEASFRYINIIILDPDPVISSPHPSYISFSEIEVLSKGENIALHAPVALSSNLTTPNKGLEKITDGLNYYGAILPQREWMDQLSRRHDLETMRPNVAAELNLRYERQNINLRRLGWLAALLAVGIVFSVLIERIFHLRQIATLQERFAADLHDELGADLHTIGLLSDLADDAHDNRKELAHLLQDIRTTTEETGEAVRLLSHMQINLPYLNLEEMMKQAAERVVVHLDHHFSIEGAHYLKNLKPRTRSDIFLFYKESLINICRHAEATRLETHLRATSGIIELSITDNGQGLPDFSVDAVPKSLRRRARLMKAHVDVERVKTGGTRIVLTLKRRKQLPFFRRKP